MAAELESAVLKVIYGGIYLQIITCKLEPFESLELYPLADVHFGDPKTDEELFKRFIKFISDQPNRFIICDGDLINNAIKTSISDIA